QAHAVMLGADERLEELVADAWRQARSSVGHADPGECPLLARANPKPSSTIWRHRFDGVADEVDEDLLDLNAVYQYRPERRVEVDGARDTLFRCARHSQHAGVFDEFRYRFDGLGHLA